MSRFPLAMPQWIALAVLTFPLPPALVAQSAYEAGPDPAASTIAVRSFQRWRGRIPPSERGVAQAFYLARRP